LTELSSVRATG